jgi:hypothetical protein
MQVRAAADSADVKHKRLMPYSCWAPRNRPKETVSRGLEVGPKVLDSVWGAFSPCGSNLP